MIRVLVVDDEALIRHGLALVLRAVGGIEVVATTTGAQALDEIIRSRPDLVLLDIRMPDVDGFTVLRQIRQLPTPPPVAILSTFDTDEHVLAALSGGAAGFILKNTDPRVLGDIVRVLAAGAVVLSPTVTRGVFGRPAGGDPDAVRRTSRLTDRERDVLHLIAAGLSNIEIGLRMRVSAATAKDHVSTILHKLGVGGRVEAALLAQRTGMLDSAKGPR